MGKKNIRRAILALNRRRECELKNLSLTHPKIESAGDVFYRLFNCGFGYNPGRHERHKKRYDLYDGDPERIRPKTLYRLNQRRLMGEWLHTIVS
jgi:hypothetical protein